jgi:hypothetical protein
VNLPIKFTGKESPKALLSSANVSQDSFGLLETSAPQTVDRIAEIRDGKF